MATHTTIPGTKRILLVEDESVFALSLEETLTRIGYTVVGVAMSGTEAIALAGGQQPDVILMDVHLHGEMDGIETAHKIKGACGIPVIFLTAYSDDETIRRIVLTEPDGYLVKPINTRELFASIESALYKRRRIDQFMEQQAAASRPVCTCGTAMTRTFSADRGGMIPVGWVCPKCHRFVQGI